MTKKKLPTLYISHGGGPCFWMTWDPPDMFEPLAESLRRIPGLVGERPKAVLVISGHWEEKTFTVQSHPNPPMLYDYYNFPKHTYDLKYPAAGSAELVERVKALVPVQEDKERGYDHGLFVPFLMIYPDADVPIVQLSMKKGLDPREHFELGKKLAPLREEGFLIVGSGLSYHNLRAIPDLKNASEPFDQWLFETLVESAPKDREQRLLEWEKAPRAREAHPREDHLIPLMVAMGAAENETANRFYSEKMRGWNFWTSSFLFG